MFSGMYILTRQLFLRRARTQDWTLSCGATLVTFNTKNTCVSILVSSISRLQSRAARVHSCAPETVPAVSESCQPLSAFTFHERFS